MDLRQWILDEHRMIQPLFRMNITSAVPVDKLAVKPASGSNSIAWLVWHVARIEDVVVNSVARGVPQVLIADKWGLRLGVDETQIGTGLNDDEVADFSRRVDVGSLLEYWDAVQRHTQPWLSDVSLDGRPTCASGWKQCPKSSHGRADGYYRFGRTSRSRSFSAG